MASIDLPPQYLEVLNASSLPDIVRIHTRRTPDRVVFTYLNDDGSEFASITYAQLEYASLSIAKILKEVLDSSSF